MESIFPIPTIFAHRGSSSEAPENTLAAFEQAVKLGAHAVELDAQLTRDGHVVVIHDHSVDRTTDGSGLVRELQLSELKKLDAGSHFNETYRDERIPTLDEVFEAVGQKILINVELKNDATPFDDLPIKVAQIVKQHNLQPRVLFSSFNPLALRKIKRQLPESACGFLVFPGLHGGIIKFLGSMIVRCEALHPDVRSVSPTLIQRLHKAGQRIHVYTVNEPVEMHKLFELGVDGVFTDKPKMALQLLEAFPISKPNG